MPGRGYLYGPGIVCWTRFPEDDTRLSIQSFGAPFKKPSFGEGLKSRFEFSQPLPCDKHGIYWILRYLKRTPMGLVDHHTTYTLIKFTLNTILAYYLEQLRIMASEYPI